MNRLMLCWVRFMMYAAQHQYAFRENKWCINTVSVQQLIGLIH